jgi:putative DNA methylase
MERRRHSELIQGNKKLIEVAMPLEAINREASRDSSNLSGHPWGLHYWWARRKLPACRAVLFGQLVNDPSCNLEEFPTLALQTTERKRLLAIMERLVIWENSSDVALYREAQAEILKSNNGKMPRIIDPFAGGGSIPIEAQRLGLEAVASDLNPVAVLINKALIELPVIWKDREPVHDGSLESKLGKWTGASGLAEDVARYGKDIGDQVRKKLEPNYPLALMENGAEVPVTAWLWSRTIECPNPACRIETTLASTWWLNKKKGHEAWLEPYVEKDKIKFKVIKKGKGPQDPPKQGRGANFKCVACQTLIRDVYVKEHATKGALGSTLLAMVVESGKRDFISGDSAQEDASRVAIPTNLPQEELAYDPRSIWCVSYGLKKFIDLFTPRQLQAIVAFSDAIRQIKEKISTDAVKKGYSLKDAKSYADTVALYLSFVLDRATDNWSSLTSWHSGNGSIRNVFARQSIPMVWDYAEANPIGEVSVAWEKLLTKYPVTIGRLGLGKKGLVTQESATVRDFSNAVLATDPPYYDNVGYSDLSDFFYIWLRRSLGDSFNEITGTVLTPKADELVASPYRHGGKEPAKKKFEDGFQEVFKHVREGHSLDIPITIFYAFKQSETDDLGIASTGWETMLNGLMSSGWVITATWPIRTELTTRSVAQGSNVLASSIVLACRPRDVSATASSRRNFIGDLRTELPVALRELQQASVAPVDLAQAAIGPGMSIFSRYSKVLEADGSDMSVRTALALINQVLDEVLTEQEGDFDAETRFCVKWFMQFGWNDAPSGEADVLSRAVNTSVTSLERGGIFKASAGKARLLSPQEMDKLWDPEHDKGISIWEVALRIANALQSDGIEKAAEWTAAARTRVDIDAVKELSYLLFSVCEKKGWTDTAILFNGLGTSWSDMNSAVSSIPSVRSSQEELDLG